MEPSTSHFHGQEIALQVAGFSRTDAWSLDLPSSSSSNDPKPQQSIHVQSFRHDRTLLRCQFASVPGPLCTAVIIVPTTVRDHSGLPHTLEHACFMGSRTHPARGFLDTAALLSLSTGTNAWTDCDSTCYTITLAGTHSLAFLLPVFLDHILNPTLTPASFTTEVYHVNGKGQEQGVVFCEMMARQDSESDVLDLALRQAIYGPESTYAYECGGLTDHIRKLTMEKIKHYHAQEYRADKIAVVALG
ncbi:Metalloenzyme, LuxS/M16 peptidase-like protein, partial [Catenaria anguillulae PL171]